MDKCDNPVVTVYEKSEAAFERWLYDMITRNQWMTLTFEQFKKELYDKSYTVYGVKGEAAKLCWTSGWIERDEGSEK